MTIDERIENRKEHRRTVRAEIARLERKSTLAQRQVDDCEAALRVRRSTLDILNSEIARLESEAKDIVVLKPGVVLAYSNGYTLTAVRISVGKLVLMDLGYRNYHTGAPESWDHRVYSDGQEVSLQALVAGGGPCVVNQPKGESASL